MRVAASGSDDEGIGDRTGSRGGSQMVVGPCLQGPRWQCTLWRTGRACVAAADVEGRAGGRHALP